MVLCCNCTCNQRWITWKNSLEHSERFLHSLWRPVEHYLPFSNGNMDCPWIYRSRFPFYTHINCIFFIQNRSFSCIDSLFYRHNPFYNHASYSMASAQGIALCYWIFILHSPVWIIGLWLKINSNVWIMNKIWHWLKINAMFK